MNFIFFSLFSFCSILFISCLSKTAPVSHRPAGLALVGSQILKNPKRLNTAVPANKIAPDEIELIVNRINQQINNQELAKYFYVNMSWCGGGLHGYYQDSALIAIDATYQGELGYSNKKIYWHKGKIIKIIYREVYPEWEKYDKKYPAELFEYDPSKVTYSDTLYTFTLSTQRQMEQLSRGKSISTKLDTSLLNRLTDCSYSMKEELDTEKILISY